MSSKVIGITGGIGTGKSTVTGILKNLGAYIIDADKIAGEVVKKGEKAMEEILIFFGNSIIKPDGELDRKKLAEIVFCDEKKLEVLNEITHKYISDKILGKLLEAKNEKSNRTIVIDAPIPIKHGFIDSVDIIWVVTADLEKRITRVMERNGIGYNDVLSRINSQDRKIDYLSYADEVIVNNGNLKELEEVVNKLFYGMQKGDYIV